MKKGGEKVDGISTGAIEKVGGGSNNQDPRKCRVPGGKGLPDWTSRVMAMRKVLIVTQGRGGEQGGGGVQTG